MLGAALRGRATLRLGAAVVLVAVMAIGAVGLWSCGGGGGSADGESADGGGGGDAAEPREEEPAPLQARLAAVPAATTVVPVDGPASAAAAVSATLFEHAPVVVVAPDGDAEAQAEAAVTALALGAPLLFSPRPTEADAAGTTAAAAAGAGAAAPGSAEAEVIADELARLAPRSVVAFGEPAEDWARGSAGDVEVVAATDDPRAAHALGGVDEGDAGSAAPAAPSDDVLVLVDRASAGIGAITTARSGGARVVAVSGADPRADPVAIAELAAQPLPDRVVAVGEGFGAAEVLRPRLEVAATGVELPGGGQVLFPHRRMVALYGHPGAPVLGVLGEQGPDAAVARAQQMAAGYEGLAPEPIVPAFEIITTVASSAPGPDGDYSAESEVADLRPWVDAAAAAGVYVVLDLQPGRTDFLTQAQRYEELLAEPHVGLALDPEWRLGPDQIHMRQIGSVGVDEVNAVAAWLAQLTRERRLPQKLLLLHQFQLRMIADRGRLDTSHDEIAVLVHADGFGTPGQKIDTWNALHSEPLANVWWGWKNFIDEDQPTFTPAETYAPDLAPWFVSYQ